MQIKECVSVAIYMKIKQSCCISFLKLEGGSADPNESYGLGAASMTLYMLRKRFHIVPAALYFLRHPTKYFLKDGN